MKLIVQIPCLNESDTLAATIADIPRALPGIDEIEILVIDDGSTDDTAMVARQLGAHHVITHMRNLGLAASFQSGIDAALESGADIIVNTDGDNQYRGHDIARLVEPILARQADIVIGDRQLTVTRQFGAFKTWLQGLGSRVVSSLSGFSTPDAVSGFRALNRRAALRLNTLSRFSYTTEMIIQASNRRLCVRSVPVRTNTVTRESRLAHNTFVFVVLQAIIIIRMYAMYRPLRFFFTLGAGLSLIGLLPVLRFLGFYLSGDGDGHLQSLILGTALLMLGGMLFITGLLSDLISQNRKILEATLERVKMQRFGDESAVGRDIDTPPASPETKKRVQDEALCDSMRTHE